MSAAPKRIFWHRELPPLDAESMGAHTVTAASEPVEYHFGARNEMWAACIDSLNAALERRLLEEIERLDGHYAHVMDERIVPKIDHANGTYHLEGRYDYVLLS